jgi:hypothetical protein
MEGRDPAVLLGVIRELLGAREKVGSGFLA